MVLFGPEEKCVLIFITAQLLYFYSKLWNQELCYALPQIHIWISSHRSLTGRQHKLAFVHFVCWNPMLCATPLNDSFIHFVSWRRDNNHLEMLIVVLFFKILFLCHVIIGTNHQQCNDLSCGLGEVSWLYFFFQIMKLGQQRTLGWS